MKTKISILFISLVILFSCGKDDADNVIDCIAESLLTIVNHETAESNPKQINFTIYYSGESQIKSVNWNFGDDTSQNVNSATTSHTYSKAGTYKVNLTINLNNGCHFDKSKNVTVE